MPRIVVADDHPDLREALRRIGVEEGHEVFTAADGGEAVEMVRSTQPDLVILDNRMPVLSGLEALARIRDFDQTVPALVFTAFADVSDIQRAILELGAKDYLTKGSGPEAIRAAIRQALAPAASGAAPAPSSEWWSERGFHDMVGRSPGMQAVFSLIERVSRSDVTVLLQGESGTGKELVARAIHDTSARAGRVHVTVDCGSLPESLIESEIFGHEAGAFTDARRSRAGRIELAHGGTLFLDEIANLPPAAQATLLRVLEDRQVTRLGGVETKAIDVRVIAATNVDLAEACRSGRFREDLYYRLDVFKITLPPLRERRQDIPMLVEHFVRRFTGEHHVDLPGGVDPAAMKLLVAHSWPGNVRELRNVLERGVLLASDRITPANLPLLLGRPDGGPAQEVTRPAAARVDLDTVPLKEAKRRAAGEVERAYIVAALERTRWNRVQAARLLGLNYKTLREKIQELGLQRPRRARLAPD